MSKRPSYCDWACPYCFTHEHPVISVVLLVVAIIMAFLV